MRFLAEYLMKAAYKTNEFPIYWYVTWLKKIKRRRITQSLASGAVASQAVPHN